MVSNTLKKLEQDIKDNITASYKDKSEILIINCSKKIITPKLELKNVIGSMRNIIYTLNDYEKYGLKKNHLNKIIKVVENNLSKNITIKINEILKE